MGCAPSSLPPAAETPGPATHAPFLAATLLALVVISVDAQSATRTVPSPYPTIQAGVDAAVAGDTVLVAAGTYYERVRIIGKNLTLLGAGPDQAFLSALTLPEVATSLLFVDGVDRSTRITGFTFEDNMIGSTNGSTGGAITCDPDGNPTIEGNRFRRNSAYYGGAILLSGFDGGVVRNNSFQGNTGAWGGGIAVMFGDDVLIENNYFEANDAVGHNQGIGTGGAIYVDFFSRVRVEANVLYANRAGYAGGLAVEGGSVVAAGNTFAFNEGYVQSSPSGLRIYGSWYDTLIAEKNIIANGIGGAAVQVIGITAGQQPHVRLDCNDFWQNAGGDFHTFLASVSHGPNDFSSDPRFCNPAAGILTLAAGSPCLPENSPTCGLVGALGLGCAAVAGVEEVANGPSSSMLRVVSHTGGTIEFHMDAGANAPSGIARLDVFDLQGRRILSTDMNIESGRGITRWDGRDDAGRILSTGVYFARVNFDGTSDRASFVLVR